MSTSPESRTELRPEEGTATTGRPLVPPRVTPAEGALTTTFAVIPARQRLEVHRARLPPLALAGRTALIKTELSLVSAGTELAVYQGTSAGVDQPGRWDAYPFRPGYAAVGRILALGPEETRFQVGDRVLFLGKHASLQRYDLGGPTAQSFALKIDEGVPAHRAVAARLLRIALSALHAASFEVGDPVAVFGLGLLGNLAAQLFQRGGARVTAVGTGPGRCALARSCGLQTVVCAGPSEQSDLVRALSGGDGVTVAVEAAGRASAAQSCVRSCATGGQVILLGTPRGAYALGPDQLYTVHQRWLQLRGAHEWGQGLPARPTTGCKRSVQSTFTQALQLVENGDIQVDQALTHTITPDEMPAVYAALAGEPDRYLGVLIDWRQC